VPPDFAAALTAAPKAETFFEQLSNSLQRYHVDQITSARTPETRDRRTGLEGAGTLIGRRPTKS
jgi:uncharacterized protein YdeI (YjbR/CyaY-like superfamily)